MPKFNDLSRSLVAFDQDSTLVAVIEMGSAGWLVGGLVPGVSRAPRKKLARLHPVDQPGRVLLELKTAAGEPRVPEGMKLHPARG